MIGDGAYQSSLTLEILARDLRTWSARRMRGERRPRGYASTGTASEWSSPAMGLASAPYRPTKCEILPLPLQPSPIRVLSADWTARAGRYSYEEKGRQRTAREGNGLVTLPQRTSAKQTRRHWPVPQETYHCSPRDRHQKQTDDGCGWPLLHTRVTPAAPTSNEWGFPV